MFAVAYPECYILFRGMRGGGRSPQYAYACVCVCEGFFTTVTCQPFFSLISFMLAIVCFNVFYDYRFLLLFVKRELTLCHLCSKMSSRSTWHIKHSKRPNFEHSRLRKKIPLRLPCGPVKTIKFFCPPETDHAQQIYRHEYY